MKVISISLPIVIIAVAVLQFFLAKSNKSGEMLEEFIAKQRILNTSRKKEIDPKFFFTPDMSKLPIAAVESEEGRLARLRADVAKRSSLKMIRMPSPMTNDEIKQRFGIANLGIVTEYEENYHNFLKCMLDWGSELIKKERYAEAEAVLLETVSMESEFSKGYFMLADLYDTNGEYDKLAVLCEKMSKVDFLVDNPMLKNKVIAYTTDKLSK